MISTTILDMQKIINSDKSYDIAIVGNSSIAIEVIYQLIILSNLPEQNRLNIYLIDIRAKEFYKKLKSYFSGIQKIPHVNILSVELDINKQSFYTDQIWKKETLTNIIVATQSKKDDLKIIQKLKKSTTLKAQIISANSYSLDSLENSELISIAKLINYLYKKTKYDPNFLFNKQYQEDAQKLWLHKISSEDRKSSIMQSLHIDTKLLALGLKREKSTKSSKKLLKINKTIFEKKLGFREIDDKRLQEYAQKFHDSNNQFEPIYFPEKFNTLFEKLIRSEHNRWCSYHYLNGWIYDKNKNKSLKKHDCLIPLEKFDKNNLKTTIIFDIYSLLYIPNIFASIGVKLIDRGSEV